MNYPDNHPFSPNYVSQYRPTPSDLKSDAARAFFLRNRHIPRATATSIKETGFSKDASLTQERSSECPRCHGPRTVKGKKQRVMDGRRQYVCGTCVVAIDLERGRL